MFLFELQRDMNNNKTRDFKASRWFSLMENILCDRIYIFCKDAFEHVCFIVTQYTMSLTVNIYNKETEIKSITHRYRNGNVTQVYIILFLL